MYDERKERLRGRLLSFLEMCSRFLGNQSVTRHYNVSFCKKLQSRDWNDLYRNMFHTMLSKQQCQLAKGRDDIGYEKGENNVQGISKPSSGITLIVLIYSWLTELCKWDDRILRAAMPWTLSTLIVCCILGSRQLLSLSVFIWSTERRYAE